MRILLYIIISVLFLSCGTEQNNSTPVEKVKFGKATAHSLSEWMDSIRIVRLNLDDSIVLGSPVRIVHCDSSFYAADIGYTSLIYRFGEDGTFLGSIGKKGKGPGEYLQLSDFYIDESTDNIYVGSYPDFRLYNFDKEGHFKSQKTLRTRSQGFTKTSEGFWIYSGHNNGYQPERVLLTDDTLGIRKKFFPLETRCLPVVNDSPFTTWKERIFLTMPLSPDICEIRGDTLFPVLNFDFGEYNVPEHFWGVQDPMQAFSDLMNKGFINLHKFIANDRYYILEFTSQKGQENPEVYYYCAVKDLRTGEWDWIRQKNSEPALVMNNEKMPDQPRTIDWYALRIQGFTKDGRMIVLADPSELKKPEDKTLIQNPEILENADPDRDIFLLLVKLKDN